MLIQEKNRKRNSNLELLRIICMLLVVAYHFCDNYMGEPLSANFVFSRIVGNWGSMCVACFLIITSWFLCDSRHFDIAKCVQIFVETVFYGGIIAVISLVIGIPTSSKTIIQGVFATIWGGVLVCHSVSVAHACKSLSDTISPWL